jgi:hypothetical protein
VFEPVLRYAVIDVSTQRWQVKYCLLLWLSVVSMIPFDLVRLDNTVTETGDGKAPVMDRILHYCKVGVKYLTRLYDLTRCLFGDYYLHTV